MNRSCALVLLAAALLPVAAAAAPPGRAELTAEVEAYLEPLLRLDLVSGSVLIARGGEILLAKGYGPADREWGVPNTPETKFRLGSLTKQFTAAAILLLEQRGELRLEDPLSRYLPDFPRADAITLHQLLTHTAGLANYNELPDYGQKMIQPLAPAEVIAWFRDQPPVSSPGEEWHYSNSDYVLLAAVIEKVTGKEYDAFLRDEIFLPLGMTATGMDVYTSVLGNRAEGYGSDGKQVYRAPYRDLPFTSGAGSLYSTVLDLFRWDRALRSDVPLGEAARTRLFTPLLSGYACGWFVEERFGRKLVTHGGAINGFLCDLQRYVEEDVTVIAMLNFESTFGRTLFRDLGAITLGEPYRPALDPEGVAVTPQVLAAAAGAYRVDDQTTLTLAAEGGRLTVQLGGEPPVAATAQNDSLYFVRDMNALMRLDRGADGQVARVVVRQGAAGFLAPRVP